MSENTPALLIAEFTVLRNEILERIKIQHQLVSLNLIVAGTFMGIGLRADSPPSIILVYPLLAMFLAAGYAHNNKRTIQVGKYIWEKIEQGTMLGWEGYVRSSSAKKSYWAPLFIFYTYGVFVFPQLITIGLSLFKRPFRDVENMLFFIDFVSIIITLIILKKHT